MNITYFGSGAATPSLADCNSIAMMIRDLDREISAQRSDAEIEAIYTSYRVQLQTHKSASEHLVAAARRQAIGDAMNEIRTSVGAIAQCATVGTPPHLMGGAIAAMVLTDAVTSGVQLFVAESPSEQYQVVRGFLGGRVSMYVHLVRGHRDPVQRRLVRCAAGLVHAHRSATQTVIKWAEVLQESERSLAEATEALSTFENATVSRAATREFLQASLTAQKSFLSAFQMAFRTTNCRDPKAPRQTPRPPPHNLG